MSASFPGQRPYVVLSCAMSVDGYLDDATDRRLILSNEADLDRVDGVRADSDAILVGANTIRRDNPRLLVRSPAPRAPRFVSDGRFPWDAAHRMALADVRRLGDVVLLRYALGDRPGAG